MLSSITWGTWDEPGAPVHSADGPADADARRRERRARMRRDAPKEKYFVQVLRVLEASTIEPQYVRWKGSGSGPRGPAGAAEGAPPRMDQTDLPHGHEVERLLRRGVAWKGLPVAANPLASGMHRDRAVRKRWQVESLITAVRPLLAGREGLTVVEFGCGTGQLALPLACEFPAHHFVLLDFNRKSIEIARARCADMRARNVTLLVGRVEDYTAPFDIGLSLHLCGGATDLALELCYRHRASFVMCPCCVGKIAHSPLEYPRSRAMRGVLRGEQYLAVAATADWGAYDVTSAEHAPHRRCKTYVETDRLAYAREFGYHCYLMKVEPLRASPKNDIIVGHPSEDRLGDLVEETQYA